MSEPMAEEPNDQPSNDFTGMFAEMDIQFLIRQAIAEVGTDPAKIRAWVLSKARDPRFEEAKVWATKRGTAQMIVEDLFTQLGFTRQLSDPRRWLSPPEPVDEEVAFDIVHRKLDVVVRSVTFLPDEPDARPH